ncbi:Pol polyprotein, partial [Mucuna pruriens]
MDYVKRCDKCQRFAKVGNARPKQLQSITSPWSFHKWEVDILGPFLPAPGQVKYLIVVVDYFTKWIEAEAIAMISVERIKRFYWKKIICRFELPTEIVLDNRTQFASRSTMNFCTQLKIKQRFMLVKQPHMNGQVEAANKGRWAEELPQVLWSYHTTPHSSTNETSFRLTLDTEAVILVEIREPLPWTILFQPVENEDEIRVNLDLLQEAHEVAQVRVRCQGSSH